MTPISELKMQELSAIGGVYMFLNVNNGMVYVGSACKNKKRSLARRLKEHLRDLNKGDHYNSRLQNTWNKHGEEAFVVGILEVCDNEHLKSREQHWIDYFRAVDEGYNVARDTSSPMRGAKLSDARRTEQSIRSKTMWANDEYRDKMTALSAERMSKPENKEFMSRSSKLRWSNPEYRDMISNKLKGKIRSDQTRQRLSASKRGKPNLKLRGRKHTPETKAKISAANKGRPSSFKGKQHTEKSKANFSAAHKGNNYCLGRVLSEETKAKISTANKGRKHEMSRRIFRWLKPPKNGKFKGVSFHKSAGMYRSSLGMGRPQVFLGWFETPEEAAMNYDYHVLAVLGRGNCYLNFPEANYEQFSPKRKLDLSGFLQIENGGFR